MLLILYTLKTNNIIFLSSTNLMTVLKTTFYRQINETVYKRLTHQVFVELLNGLFKVSRELDLFPQPVGEGGPFDGLHEEVADSILLSDGRVLGIGQRTGGPVAKAGQVVLVPAKLLGLGL
jgi:hypothetical protein